MYSTTIPFQGFYESLHDSMLDDTLNQAFSDRDTGCNINHALVNRAMGKLNWGRVFKEYAKEYCENFATHMQIKLEFDELVSPREYNFTTDRIFAKMDEATLRSIRARVGEPQLRQQIQANHTSRDGFFSFYENTLEAWPEDVTEWDHNQIGTLMEALVLTDFPDWDRWEEYRLMEDAGSNGVIDNILFDDPYMERLGKIWCYLDETRKERTATV